MQAPRRATSYHRSTPSLQHAPLRMPPDFVQSCRGSECAPLRMGSRHHDKRGSTSRRSLLVHCAHADVLTLVHLSHSSHCEEWYCDSATLTLLADILHPRPRLKVRA